MSLTIVVLSALLLDFWLGEPRRFHPLAGFGTLATQVERLFYANTKRHGCLAVLLVISPFVLLTIAITTTLPTIIYGQLWQTAFEILVLYLAIGWKSLDLHAKRVYQALWADNLPQARQHVAMMVSRDTNQLDHTGVTKGAIESVLENGNDAIFGVIFWFIIAGAPGAIAYRLINTLDAMWGYRNQRYCQFGWAAARLDDCFNWVPARLTALSYALAGKVQPAFKCWQTQAAIWKSPNAGPVMASGAGSLNILLGGSAYYHGKRQSRPILGAGSPPDTQAIRLALRLINRALVIWLVILCLGEWFVQSTTTI